MSSADLATKADLQAREKAQADLEDSRRLDWEQENEDKINEMAGIKVRGPCETRKQTNRRLYSRGATTARRRSKRTFLNVICERHL